MPALDQRLAKAFADGRESGEAMGVNENIARNDSRGA